MYKGPQHIYTKSVEEQQYNYYIHVRRYTRQQHSLQNSEKVLQWY